MKRLTDIRKIILHTATVGSLAMVFVSQAQSAEYWMCADELSITMPDATVIPMWGFALDDNNDLADGCTNPPSVPGPELLVPDGDSQLTVHLRNDLPDPVSLIVHGQMAAMVPVFFTDGEGRRRARSLTHETAAGTQGTYSWSSFKPGTYLYQSGSHPAVQVQMGLYGAAMKDAAPGEAYAGVTYQNQLTLLYSEIDPALHAAVSTLDYGTPVFPSTQNYQPKYFLVNGQPYDPGTTPPLVAGNAGEITLLRFLNSGLEMHAPMFNNLYMKVVAEDGNSYPYPREQYSLMLAPGKTRDALIIPVSQDPAVLYDRRLRLTNNTQGSGGHLSILNFGPNEAPVAVDDRVRMAPSYTSIPNSQVIDLTANDLDAMLDPATLNIVVNPREGGTVVNNGDGSVTFTPAADWIGNDRFRYTVKDTSGLESNRALVVVEVRNSKPVAVDDKATMTPNYISAPNSITIDVVANDTDDLLVPSSLVLSTPTSKSGGTLVNHADGTVTYTPPVNFEGRDVFRYRVGDFFGKQSNEARVVIRVKAVN